jgi:Xaa-Pro dipeptidase
MIFVFRSGDVNDMMSANVPAVLMPHGLGHLLGIDTHDVGGYPAGIERDARDGYRSVRCGLRLQPGMVITVEPGIYFISHCLKKGFSDPQVVGITIIDSLLLTTFLMQTGFFNWEAIDGYRDFGGIRLEDNVLITDIGIENLTTAPRTVSDVEGVMQVRLRTHDTIILLTAVSKGRITSLAQLHKRL